MSIESRVEMTRAALRDMGRGDLADRIVDAATIRSLFPNDEHDAIRWWPIDDIDDEIIIRRAAALAVLADGHDARETYCEPCIRAPSDPGCTKVTRREFLAHQPCSLHASGVAEGTAG